MNVMDYLFDNGFSGMSVVNLFSYMSTNPKELKFCRTDYEIINNEYIKQAFEEASIIIIAWTRGEKILAKRKIKEILTQYRDKLKYFRIAMLLLSLIALRIFILRI